MGRGVLQRQDARAPSNLQTGAAVDAGDEVVAHSVPVWQELNWLPGKVADPSTRLDPYDRVRVDFGPPYGVRPVPRQCLRRTTAGSDAGAGRGRGRGAGASAAAAVPPASKYLVAPPAKRKCNCYWGCGGGRGLPYFGRGRAEVDAAEYARHAPECDGVDPFTPCHDSSAPTAPAPADSSDPFAVALAAADDDDAAAGAEPAAACALSAEAAGGSGKPASPEFPDGHPGGCFCEECKAIRAAAAAAAAPPGCVIRAEGPGRWAVEMSVAGAPPGEKTVSERNLSPLSRCGPCRPTPERRGGRAGEYAGSLRCDPSQWAPERRECVWEAGDSDFEDSEAENRPFADPRRHAQPAVHPGNWTCAACGARNLEGRSQCWRCQEVSMNAVAAAAPVVPATFPFVPHKEEVPSAPEPTDSAGYLST